MEEVTQTHANLTTGCRFPLPELEQIEAAIVTARNWLTTLQTRREVLTAELDRITEPAPALAVAPRTMGPGFGHRGTLYRHWNYIAIHTALLRRL